MELISLDREEGKDKPNEFSKELRLIEYNSSAERVGVDTAVDIFTFTLPGPYRSVKM